MRDNKCPVIPGAQHCLFTTSEEGIELQQGIRIPMQEALGAEVDEKGAVGASRADTSRLFASLPVPFLVRATETMLQVKWLGENRERERLRLEKRDKRAREERSNTLRGKLKR